MRDRSRRRCAGSSGATSNATQIVTLTPSSGTATTAEIKALVGATSSAAGKAGLVPVPPKDGYNTKFLRADGTWVVPTNTTYSLTTGTTYNSDNTAQQVKLTPTGSTAQVATIAAMVGADGTNAGKAGLVPKPAATDNTKPRRRRSSSSGRSREGTGPATRHTR